MKKSRTNKKGNWFVENLGQIVLAAIGIGIGIYFLWAYVLHGGGDTTKTLQTCGALTGSQGQCKEACDKNLELELPNVGCSGVANICCVLKDTGNGDVILPTGYGQSEKYDFSVGAIAVDKTTAIQKGCQIMNGDSSSVRCTAGNDINIPIIITVTNTGTEKVNVFADPVIVIMDNADTVKENKFIGTRTDIAAKATVNLVTTIKISAADAKSNSYWEIYPYAKCDTSYCQGADLSSRGIYRKDPTNHNVLTIKFVDQI